MRALDFIGSEPWLITDEAMQMIIAIAERTNDIDALVARDGKRLMNSRTVTMRGDTAIIPITGPIFRYANLFTAISGATSTEVLAKDIQTAIDDPLVQAIVLNIDSPGGAASGINELGDMIYSARGSKPIVTYSGGQIASAGYWLGSAADEIVIDRTTLAGSIGAKLSIMDTSGRDAKAGVRSIEIVSSQSPDKVLDLNNDEGRAKVQKMVDDLAGVFVETVARNRGIDTSTVLSDYGRGGMMVGNVAIAAGLADRLGSLEQVIGELAAARESKRRSYFMTRTQTNGQQATAKGPITVSNTTELRAALAAGHSDEEITVRTLDEAAIRAEGHAAGVAEEVTRGQALVAKAKDEATLAERTRIVGLNSIAVKGFEKEVQAAVESGATIEATAVDIAKASKARGTTMAANIADASEVVTHGGKGKQVTAGSQGEKPWGKITERFKKKTG